MWFSLALGTPNNIIGGHDGGIVKTFHLEFGGKIDSFFIFRPMKTMIGGGTNTLPLTLHRRFLHGKCISWIGLSQVFNTVYFIPPTSSTAHGLRHRHEANRSLSIKKFPRDVGINTSDFYSRLLCRHDRVQLPRNFSSLQMDDGDARVLNQVRKFNNTGTYFLHSRSR